MDNRRRFTRYEVALAAELDVPGSFDTLIGETRDVSEGGASVILQQPLVEDSVVDLQLILTEDGIEDPSEDPFTANASVMWTAPTDDGRAMVGLRFGKLDAQETRRLKRFLSRVADASKQ
jgi:c-di-GMP-binding flagellar brake protein YcgR